MANLEVINVGAEPNDGTGDPIRTAFTKTNTNFESLNSEIGNINVNSSITIAENGANVGLARTINFAGPGVSVSTPPTPFQVDVTITSAGGDVAGPAISIDNELALFSGSSGKVIKRAIASGIIKATNGVIGTAVAGVDYQAAINLTGILKGAGNGSVSTATAGTDYLAPSAIGNTVQGYDSYTAKLNVAQTWTAVQIFGAANCDHKVAIPYAGTNIDLALGNYFTINLTGIISQSITVSNVSITGSVTSFILETTDAGGATITWPNGMTWAGGTPPTLTSVGVDILGFYTFDNGTTWRGLVLAKDIK